MSLCSEPLDKLREGLESLGLRVDQDQADSLLKFLDLMGKWGGTYNLTAIRDVSRAIDLHLLDSLAVSQYVHGQTVLDVGTGAGLPGIPLAILSRDRRFVLIDRSAKKIRFVQQAIMELRLHNVKAVACRVEEYSPVGGFDTVIARAFASLPDLIVLTSHLLSSDGRILAMKGRFPTDEMQLIDDCGARVHELKIPGVDAERHLIEIRVG